MSDVKALLDRMAKALGALDGSGETSPEPVKMSPEAFLAYAAEQVEKAAKDAPAVRVKRLKSLRDNVAAIAKNFEGPTPTQDAVPVVQFHDADQLDPTSEVIGSPPDQPAGATNFAQNDTPPNVAGAGSTPTGGELPPIVAPSSGFNSVDAAVFAKGIEQLAGKLGALEAAVQKSATTPAAPATTTVEKATRVLWPVDMNRELSADDADDDSAWGLDAAPAK